MQPSEEIKQRLDIVDVIKEYIPLKAAGINFRAKCPFHNENTPSFMVSSDKQIYHCFGCGKGGDIFSFVMEMEGIDFVEALRLLAPKAGVVLKREDPKIRSERNKILDIIDLSRKYYYKFLRDSKIAQKARDYLEERGLNEEDLDEWQIGFAPDSWDTIVNGLKKNGYSDKEILLAGMASRSTTSSKIYDRFRGRIMFPINDVNGNVVAFTARVSPEKEAEEKQGKYINSPQTPVFDKSRILFGLDKAKMEIKRQDYVIIVEGQMDVITAHVNGFKNVIASSGTALTQEQIRMIKRYTNNIMLAFDQDNAGEMAADRGIREAMKEEMNIKVIEVPEGKDPDDCIRTNIEAWKKAVKNAKSMMQYYFDKTLNPLDLKQVENQRSATQKLIPIIAKLGNKIEEDYWTKTLSENIGRDEQVIREILKTFKKPVPNYVTNKMDDIKVESEKRVYKDEVLGEMLLAILFVGPSLMEYAQNNLRIEEVPGEYHKALYKKMLFFYNSNQGMIDYHQLKKVIGDENKHKNNDKLNQLKLLDKLVFLSERDYYNFELIDLKKELISVINNLKRIYIKTRMQEIEAMILEIEKNEKNENLRKQNINELLDQFSSLSKELKDV